MSSINGYGYSALHYQAFEIPKPNKNNTPRHNPLDRTARNDAEVFHGIPKVNKDHTPLRNPLDPTAGDDAEVFDANTQSWQPTASAGNGYHLNKGAPYREPIDFEIRPDGNGGWQKG